MSTDRVPTNAAVPVDGSTDRVPTNAAVPVDGSADRAPTNAAVPVDGSPNAAVPVNAAALLVGRVVGAALMLVVVSIAAHRLPDDDFGLVVSVLAAGFLANTVVTFGTDTVVVREVASGSERSHATALASLRLQLIAALGFVAAAAAGVALTSLPAVVLIQAAGLLPLAVLTVAGAVLRGREQMVRLLVASVAGAVVTLVATIVGFALADEPWVPIAAVAVGGAVAAIVAAAGARLLRHAPSDASIRLGTLIAETAPFAVMVVLAAVGAQGGLLLVELAGDDPAGGYGVAVRLTEAARLVPAAVMGALFPTMIAGNIATRQYSRWVRRLAAFAVAATAVLLVAAETINDVVFDDQPDGTTLIRILGVGIGLIVLRLKLSFELIAERRERLVLAAAVAATTVFLAAGLAGVLTVGAVGVAWAQNAGLAVAVGVMVLARRRN